MSDRELLEWAAKAAGYVIDQRASSMTWRDCRKLALLNPQGGHTLWNAEDDDGDALRLAVKLGLRVYIYPSAGDDFTIAAGDELTNTVSVREPHGSDPYAATRRAVVRAAASIGQSQENKKPPETLTQPEKPE